MDLTSTRAREMETYLPPFYADSVVMAELLDALGSEFDKASDAVTAILNSAFVRTADDFALDRWEDELLIPRNPSLTITERRDRIVAKLRGYGTATKALVKSVAESFVYGTVNVYDLNDEITTADLSFTRATVARKKDFSEVASGVPRYEAGKYGNSMMIEESTINLVQRSQEFDNAYWTKSNSTVSANAIAAPDGTTTADKIVEDTTAGVGHSVNRLNVLTVGSAFAISVFAKAGERTWLRVQCDGTTRAWFNLANGTVGTTTGVTAMITPMGDGWYRCAIWAASAPIGSVVYAPAIADGSAGHDGDGTSGLYLWGAQAEARQQTTSYMPTTSATASRNYESVLTPAVDGGLLNLAAGAIEFWMYFDQHWTGARPTGNSRFLWAIGAAGVAGAFQMFREVGFDNRYGIRFYDDTAAVRVFNVTAGPFAEGWHHFAITWDATTVYLYIDGVLRGSGTPTRPSAFVAATGLRLGGQGVSVTQMPNTLFDDLRLSSRTRTAAEIAAVYASGAPAPTDADTTFKAPFDGSLAAGPDFDLPDYTVRITFIDEQGIPSNIADVQAALRAVIPAHLAIEYEYNFTLWDEVDAQNYTWDQVDALNLTWDQWDVHL